MKEPSTASHAKAFALVHQIIAGSVHKFTYEEMALIARAVADDLDADADDAARLGRVDQEVRALVQAIYADPARKV